MGNATKCPKCRSTQAVKDGNRYKLCIITVKGQWLQYGPILHSWDAVERAIATANTKGDDPRAIAFQRWVCRDCGHRWEVGPKDRARITPKDQVIYDVFLSVGAIKGTRRWLQQNGMPKIQPETIRRVVAKVSRLLIRKNIDA